MLDLPAARRSRKPSLTPMIDVVFLLLVFFMLASRFGANMSLPLVLAGGGTETTYEGPPRVIDILPEGLRLNGVGMEAEALLAALPGLMSGPEDALILRPREEADLQRLVDTMQVLETAGFGTLVVVE